MRNLLLMFLCVSLNVFAESEKKPITVEDVWAVKRIGAPSISPDGKWVAVDLTSYEMKENNSTSDIWLLPTSEGEKRQLTAHSAKDGGPIWSPDGQTILFLSKREGDDAAQIYLISPSGGEARRLTKIPTGAASPKWFPNSKQIAFISWVWTDLKTDEEQAARLKERKEAKVKAHVIDTTNFRFWDHWLADGRRAHLFVVDVETGQHRDLFAGTNYHFFWYENSADLNSGYFDISPDGKEVAFVIDATPDPGLDPNADIITMAIEGGKGSNITSENKASDSSPVYSPDGKWLAYTKQVIPRFGGDRERVVLRDRKSAIAKVLTEEWDRSAGSLVWHPDSQKLYFTAEDQAKAPLWELKISENVPRNITAKNGTTTAFDISADGKTMTYVRSSISTPGNLFVATIDGKNERKVESFNDQLVSNWKLGEVKEMNYKGWNDEPIQMWIVHPPDFDSKKKWPLLHVIHGGPHGATLDQFHYRWNLQLFASRGFVVAGVNFHGSTGFGQAFTDSIHGQYGTKEFADVEKGTDALLATGYIDENRLTASGGSFGGFMVAWINGHSNRYKALVCHAGVYNWISQMASDIVVGRDRALGGFHWDNPEKVASQSAHTYAKNFKTPTLVIHGERDFRVPATQGLEYYSTLRMLGVPARLVYLEEENHWVLKPQTSKLWHQEFFNWIEKYAKPGPG
jgi:dipeptidyl aminopeptidase/acylaminoacyl peptidase